MAADGQVVFEISGNNAPLKQSLNDATNSIKQESAKWDKTAGDTSNSMASKLGNAFGKVAGVLAAAKIGQALAQFGQEAVAAASDLREVQNVVDVTFEDSTAQIDSWAKNAQRQYGLTETQAKRFASTMGAMLKSSGMAASEIVDVSKDLAGLAADMASFYNMDYETAFAKIRAGIAGETEPLKQLGINMSVANMEAFALTQGITKAYKEMSQSEQYMLRYQYLMQATADAQGDFSRTSDGFANSQRRIQTALTTIATNVGDFLLQTVEPATDKLAEFLEKLTMPKERTVLDEINDIEIDTQKKIADINRIAGEAQILLDVLDEIAKPKENKDLTEFVNAFSESISSLDGPLAAAKNNDYSGTISNMAAALSKELGGDPAKWENLLKAIGNNAGGAISAVSGDAGATEAFLTSVAEGADDLTTDYSTYWEELLAALGDNAESAITALSNGSNTGSVLSGIASGANILDASKPGVWQSLFTSLKKVDGLQNLFKNSNGADNVKALAKALSGASPDTTRAEAWQTFLGALQENSGALSALTETSAEETAAWLETVADAANKIDPSDAEAWNKLLANFLGDMPGFANSEAGKEFFEQMTQNFLGMGSENAEAKAGLLALGYSTDEIDAKQKEWLETCNRLVKTIPGLSEIINTETGAVEGGVDAIGEYVEEWKRGQEKLIMWKAYYAKKEALMVSEDGIAAASIDKMAAEAAVENARKKFSDLYKELTKHDVTEEWFDYPDELPNYLANTSFLNSYGHKNYEQLIGPWYEYVAAVKAAEEADKHLTETQEANAEASETLAILYDYLVKMYGEVTDGNEDAAEAMTILQKAAEGDENALKGVKSALSEVDSALKAVADYQANIREETRRTVESVAKGFQEVQTPVDKTRQQVKDLKKTITDANKDEIDLKIADIENQAPTIQSMTKGLQSQLDYFKRYQKAMDDAKAKGVSADVLAWLADGSLESLDYLEALASGAGDIDTLNEKYAEVMAESEKFSNSLADQKLQADDAYQSLVDKAISAVEQLNLGEAAKTSVEQTVQGIVDGLAGKASEVDEQVNSIIASIGRLSSFGIFDLMGLGKFFFLNGSHADGLDYVPFDHYLAELHEGEGILTAEENKVWQNFKAGQMSSRNSMDYGALSGAIWDNAPNMGGNVYLDGRTVGKLISAQQANAYRNLERSGWRA